MGTVEIGNHRGLWDRNLRRLLPLVADRTRDYGQTFVAEFMVLLCQLLTYKLAAKFLGTVAFAEYALAKRTISLVYPISLLGLAVALPRYIAKATGTGEMSAVIRYASASVWCIGAALTLCVGVMNLFPGSFAYLFFGGQQYRGLALPLSLWLVGLTLHAVAYGYFRGRLNMKSANLLQVINIGFAPLLAFSLSRTDIREYLMTLGVLTTAISMLTLIFLPLRRFDHEVREEAKVLLHYGLQRVPGEFFQMGLFTLPATFVAHMSGIKEAGYVALATSVLTMIGSMFAPLGLVLLPKASRMLASGEMNELREHTLQVLVGVSAVSISAAMLIALFAPTVTRVFLGPGVEEAVFVLRVMLLAAVPYSFYSVARNLIDAFHKNAVNAKNLLMAFLLFLAISLSWKLASGSSSQILYAFVVAMFLLAVLTAQQTRKILVAAR